MHEVGPAIERVDAKASELLIQWCRGLYVRWANSELSAGRFKKAIDVLEDGLRRSPDHGKLINNLAFAVQEYATDVLNRHGVKKARAELEVLRERFSDRPDVLDVARNHARRVFFRLRDSGDHRRAIDSVSDHAEFFESEAERSDLKTEGYCQWAVSLVKNRDWGEAMDVYEKGLRSFPDSRRLKKNLVYHTQEWAKQIANKDGSESAVRILQSQQRRFPATQGIRDVTENHASRTVSAILGKQDFDGALTTLDLYQDLLDEQKTQRLACSVYDRWSESFQTNQDWQGAIDTYARGLKRFPDSKHLRHNAIVMWQSWAGAHMDKEEWAKAIDVYEKSLAQFPKDRHLINNLKYCQHELDRSKGRNE